MCHELTGSVQCTCYHLSPPFPLLFNGVQEHKLMREFTRANPAWYIRPISNDPASWKRYIPKHSPAIPEDADVETVAIGLLKNTGGHYKYISHRAPRVGCVARCPSAPLCCCLHHHHQSPSPSPSPSHHHHHEHAHFIFWLRI